MYCVKLFLITALICISSAFTMETRGTWLTTIGNDLISNPEKTMETMQKLKSIGINTVYVESWLDGYTFFHSNTMYNLIGESIDPKYKNRDLLKEMIDCAHANNLTVIAWFEFGNMASFGDHLQNKLRKLHPEWLLRNSQGSDVAPDGFVWMNIANYRVQDLLINITLDCINSYDVDGIQFDDHLGWPVSMAYDNFTRNLYWNEKRKPVPENYRDDELIQWRSSKISQFVHKLVQTIKNHSQRNILLSISPSVFDFSYTEFCTDWIPWYTSNLFDEYIPQAYRHKLSDFQNTWSKQIDYLGGDVRKLKAGIMFEEGDFLVPWIEAKGMLDYVRQSKAQGQIIWYSKSVVQKYNQELWQYYHSNNNHH